MKKDCAQEGKRCQTVKERFSFSFVMIYVSTIRRKYMFLKYVIENCKLDKVAPTTETMFEPCSLLGLLLVSHLLLNVGQVGQGGSYDRD